MNGFFGSRFKRSYERAISMEQLAEHLNVKATSVPGTRTTGYSASVPVMKPPYIFDASSIRVIGNYYPDHFPTFWVQFEQAVSDGEVKSVREVYNELELQVPVTEKEIWKWIKGAQRNVCGSRWR